MRTVLTALGVGALVVAATSGWLAWQCHRPRRLRADWRPVFDDRNTYDTEA